MIATQWTLIAIGIRFRILVALGVADLAVTFLIQLALRVVAVLGPFMQIST